MKKPKPDRFERMVARGYTGNTVRPQDLILAVDVIKLLRRQHRAMVRMVQNMPRVPYLVSDSLMRDDVIETLRQYAK